MPVFFLSTVRGADAFVFHWGIQYTDARPELGIVVTTNGLENDEFPEALFPGRTALFGVNAGTGRRHVSVCR